MRALVLAGLVACSAASSRLSPPQILSAAGHVEPGDTWSEVRIRIVQRLGLPTRVEGDSYRWAATTGPDCYLIEIRVHDDRVVYVDDPYRRDAIEGSYQRCTTAAR